MDLALMLLALDRERVRCCDLDLDLELRSLSAVSVARALFKSKASGSPPTFQRERTSCVAPPNEWLMLGGETVLRSNRP